MPQAFQPACEFAAEMSTDSQPFKLVKAHRCTLTRRDMRASRILALSSLAIVLCVFLAACGGGSKPKPPAGPPFITSTTLPQATVNNGYSFYLQASGGTGTYTWSITSG